MRWAPVKKGRRVLDVLPINAKLVFRKWKFIGADSMIVCVHIRNRIVCHLKHF